MKPALVSERSPLPSRRTEVKLLRNNTSGTYVDLTENISYCLCMLIGEGNNELDRRRKLIDWSPNKTDWLVIPPNGGRMVPLAQTERRLRIS